VNCSSVSSTGIAAILLLVPVLLWFPINLLFYHSGA
jgi:hypothetical protein